MTPDVDNCSAFGAEIAELLEAVPRQSSVRLTSEQLEVIYAMAYAHVTLRQFSRALPIFTILVTYGPTRKHYLNGLALCMQMCNRLDEAIALYSLVGTLYPDSVEAMLQVVECEMLQGGLAQADAALQLVEACLAEKPGGNEAVAPRATLLRKRLAGREH